jgi:hypothetical protein
MEKTNKPEDFESSLKQKYYNLGQICIFQHMQMSGIVKDWQDYAKRFAPIYELFIEGSIEYAELDTEEIRERVKAVTKGI